jgi:ABC-2 type transport system ATP-binding protein
LSFKLYSGRIYGLLGPNGAGKSTTMNMITGCLSPSEGSIRINGFDLFEQPLKAKRLIGYLPELPPLYADMTVAEYLTFIAEAKGVHPERVRRQVNDAMELTDTLSVADRLIAHLSKGYGQRVGIAQALLGNPEVIILDEPTVGLDPRQITEIRELLRALRENRTIIISSHILAEISEVCDELLVINHGELVASGTIDELNAMLGETDSLHLTVRGDESGVCAVLEGIEGVVRYEPLPGETGSVCLRVYAERGRDVRDDIFFAMAERRYAVLGMELEQKTLEKVFLSLTESTEAGRAESTPDEDDSVEKEGEVEQ